MTHTHTEREKKEKERETEQREREKERELREIVSQNEKKFARTEQLNLIVKFEKVISVFVVLVVIIGAAGAAGRAVAVGFGSLFTVHRLHFVVRFLVGFVGFLVKSQLFFG